MLGFPNSRGETLLLIDFGFLSGYHSDLHSLGKSVNRGHFSTIKSLLENPPLYRSEDE